MSNHRLQDPAEGDQGRLASLRAELLSTLPAGRASRGADRYLDLSSWLPLHQARDDGMMMLTFKSLSTLIAFSVLKQ